MRFREITCVGLPSKFVNRLRYLKSVENDGHFALKLVYDFMMSVLEFSSKLEETVFSVRTEMRPKKQLTM
jgi:hypothetical protein